MTKNETDAGRSPWALRDIFYENVSALRQDFKIIDKKAYFWLRLLIAIAIALSVYSFQQAADLSSAYIFAVLAFSPLFFCQGFNYFWQPGSPTLFILLSGVQLFLATWVTHTFTGIFMPDSQSDLADWLKDAKPDLGWEEIGEIQAQSAWKAAKDVQVAVERKANRLKTAEWLIALSIPCSLAAGASACFGVTPFELWRFGGIIALSFVLGFGVCLRCFLVGHHQSL